MLTPRRLFTTITLLALAALTACSSGPEERDPEELFTLYRESAFYYWQAGDFTRAEAQALSALDIHPDDLSCNLYVGNIGLMKGTTKDLLGAEARFRSMEQQDDFRVQLGLGETLERLGMVYEEAAAAIESGQRTTEAPDPAARVAELHKMASDAWSEASDRFHTVLETWPNEADAINGLQRVLALQGDLEGALVWTNRPIALVDIDLSYYRSKLTRESITPEEEEILRERMSNSLNLAERTYLLGASILRELGRSEAELEYLEKATEIAPKTPNTWSRKAQAQMALAHYDKAIASLDTFLRLSDEPFGSADVQRAYELRELCEKSIQEAAFTARFDALETPK
jgi:tetratricopeptide (TPR) repeat protein